MAENRRRDNDDAVEAAETQPDVETPKEIATPKAAEHATPEVRRQAMAAENASALASAAVVGDKDREARIKRADEMAEENAAAAMPMDDDDVRQERMRRAGEMARENATS